MFPYKQADDASSQSDPEEIMVIKNSSRRNRNLASSGYEHGNREEEGPEDFWLQDLTHLLEATVDQLNDYVFSAGKSSLAISREKREKVCHKLYNSIASARTRILSGYTIYLLQRHRHLTRLAHTNKSECVL